MARGLRDPKATVKREVPIVAGGADAATVVTVPSDHPDAELFTLVAEYRKAMEAWGAAAGDKAAERDAGEREDAALRGMAALPAHTPDGIALKFRHLLEAIRDGTTDFDEKIAITALEDLARLGRQATPEAGDDGPIFALEQEAQRVDAESERLGDLLDQRAKGLPPWAQDPPSVIVGEGSTAWLGGERAFTVKEIDSHFGLVLSSSSSRESDVVERRREVPMLRQYRDTLVADLEQKRAARKAEQERAGLPELNARWEALRDEFYALNDRIVAMPANTVAGLAVKLRIALKFRDVMNWPDENRDFDYEATRSALKDAERLSGGAS